MATISKGITLAYRIIPKEGEAGEFTVLKDLQEIPELGGDTEAIEITTLADAAHMYTNGIKNYGDSLTFKFLYEKAQFAALGALIDEVEWQVSLPDEATCSFNGVCSVKLDGVGVNAALTYSLAVKPTSEMVWA